MRKIKTFLCMALAAALTMGAVPLTSLASTDYTYISSVSIKVHVDLEAGDEINDGDDISIGNGGGSGTYVYCSGSKYSIESAQWATDKEVGIGDTPKIEVYLDPDTSGSKEYRFRSSYSSSSVSISGGTFVSATRKGEQLRVILKVNGIKGTYSEPEEAEWGSKTGKATWEDGDDSSGYFDIYLYRGSSIVKKVEDYKGNSYNFYPYMTKEGTYTFKVRTVPHSSSETTYGKKSEWVESGDLYIDEDDVSDGTGQESGTSTGSSSTSSSDVGWVQNGSSWYFRYPTGDYQKSGWLKWNDKWYLFDDSGKMLTGWQQKDGYWYYLGESGDMKTGWVSSSDKWYYLNPNADGPEGTMIKNCWLTINGKTYFINESGVMAEGWQMVENNYYYFYPGDGSKAVNTSINGFTLDANGVWVH